MLLFILRGVTESSWTTQLLTLAIFWPNTMQCWSMIIFFVSIDRTSVFSKSKPSITRYSCSSGITIVLSGNDHCLSLTQVNGNNTHYYIIIFQCYLSDNKTLSLLVSIHSHICQCERTSPTERAPLKHSQVFNPKVPKASSINTHGVNCRLSDATDGGRPSLHPLSSYVIHNCAMKGEMSGNFNCRIMGISLCSLEWFWTNLNKLVHTFWLHWLCQISR